MLTIILSEQKKYGQVIELQNESWKKCDCKLVRRFGGVSKSMLALNKSVMKVKESQIKGFKMIFELFRKVATSPKSTPDSMTNSTIVTFNTDGKKLTDHLLATLKCCNKTIPVITRNSSILNPKLFKSSFKTLNRC